MFLSPVKEKLSVQYPEMLEVLGEANERLHDELIDKSYFVSREHPVYRCDNYDRVLPKLIQLAAERTDGYFVPGTDVPYLTVILRTFGRLIETGFAVGEQLAGVAWLLVQHQFASFEEIHTICGDYAANFVSSENKTDYENYTVCYYRYSLQNKFCQIEAGVVLTILRGLRKKHDRAFLAKYPKPIKYLQRCKEEEIEEDHRHKIARDGEPDPENDEYYDFDEYEKYYYKIKYGNKNDCYSMEDEYDEDIYDYDEDLGIDIKVGVNEYGENDLAYHRDGYTYLSDEKGKFIYTAQYMNYCDRCQELFWKRFGVSYQELEKYLYEIFSTTSGLIGTDCNDAIYNIDYLNQESIRWNHGYLHAMLM